MESRFGHYLVTIDKLGNKTHVDILVVFSVLHAHTVTFIGNEDFITELSVRNWFM